MILEAAGLASAWASRDRHGLLVSVGMPTYNKAPFLLQAVDSVLKQTFRDFELIISDDQSTDDSQRMLQKYAARDSRIRLYWQPKQLGMTANFDFVMREARGHYFCWLSGDDVMDERWLETLLREMSDKTAIALGRVVNIDSDGKFVREVPVREFRGSRIGRLARHFFSLAGNCNYLHGLMRTSFVQTIGGVSQFSYGGTGFDALFVRRCLHDGWLQRTGEACLYKRLSPHDSHMERRSWQECFVMAFAPMLPIKRVLYLYGVDRGWPIRAAMGVLILPRILLGLVEWYVKALRFVGARLAGRTRSG